MVDGHEKVDWNQLRLPAEQVDMAGLNPHDCAQRIRNWLGGPDPKRMFGIQFNIAEYSPLQRTLARIHNDDLL